MSILKAHGLPDINKFRARKKIATPKKKPVRPRSVDSIVRWIIKWTGSDWDNVDEANRVLKDMGVPARDIQKANRILERIDM